jgi:hypothetical protein
MKRQPLSSERMTSSTLRTSDGLFSTGNLFYSKILAKSGEMSWLHPFSRAKYRKRYLLEKEHKREPRKLRATMSFNKKSPSRLKST